MNAILEMKPDDAPDMVAFTLGYLLFKLGGQVTVSLVELEQINRDFPHVRFALTRSIDRPDDPMSYSLTLTIISKEHWENDRKSAREAK